MFWKRRFPQPLPKETISEDDDWREHGKMNENGGYQKRRNNIDSILCCCFLFFMDQNPLCEFRLTSSQHRLNIQHAVTRLDELQS